MAFNPVEKNTRDAMTNYVSLVYAPSKTGKTTLLRDVDYILNTAGEDGLASISDKNIPYYDITGTEATVEILDFITKDPRVKDKTCLAIDNLSWLANRLFVRKLLGTRKVLTWADWDILGTDIDDFIMKLKKTGKEVICTAWQQIVKNEAAGVLMGVPDIGTRNYSMEISALFDCVIRLSSSIDSGKRKVLGYTIAEGLYVAGIRKPMSIELPPMIDFTNTTMREFLQTLKPKENK